MRAVITSPLRVRLHETVPTAWTPVSNEDGPIGINVTHFLHGTATAPAPSRVKGPEELIFNQKIYSEIEDLL